VFSRITKFFPPLVTGIVITTIGLTLMPVAARWAMGGNSRAPDFGSMPNIGLAALTLVLVLLLSKVGSATISRLSILLAMVIGTVIAVLLGMADFPVSPRGRCSASPRRSTSACRPFIRRDPVDVHRGDGDPGGNLGGHPGGG
jgi:xanthine/uracil permease